MLNRNGNSSNSINRAAPRPLESVQEFASCSYAPTEGSCFKENVDVNKSGTPKLNLDPLQMKRKKKGGGCNLRKSLAWDRAFFTEEGVLDPLELSIITGASCGEASPSINNGTSSNSKRTLKPTDYQSSQKIKAGSGSKSMSKCGGCPRPLSSSSLKRAGNLNAAKSTMKESTLQKIPSSKTGPTPIQTSKRKIPRPISINSGQIDQPALTIRTNRSSGTSSKTPKTTLTTPKPGTLQQRNSCFEEHTSTNPSQILAVKADEDSDSKIITLNTTPSSPVHSSVDTGKSIPASTSITWDAHGSGLNMRSSQNQTMKPSGLRMPSPSLSFFSKPKALNTRDLSSRDADSSIFESLKPGSLRLQDNFRTPQKDNNILYSTGSISRGTGISFSSECSVSPHVNDTSCETVKSNLERNSTDSMEMKVSSDALHPLIGSESIEDDAFDGHIQDHSKKNRILRISPPEAVQNIDKEMLSEDVSYNREVNPSSDGRWRNPKLVSEDNHGTYASEKEGASDEPSKESSASVLCMLNEDATSISTDLRYVLDHRCQNHLEMQETACERSCSELHNGDFDQAIPSPVVTDSTVSGDENVLNTKQIVTEFLDGSQQSGTQYSCSKHSNVEFKHECESLLDEAVCRGAATENLLGCEEYLPKAEFASPADGCGESLDVISDVGENLVRRGSEGKTVCHEVYSEFETDEGTSLRDRLSGVASEERWQANFSHDLAAQRLSSNLCQATLKVENDDCNSFPLTMAYEVPPRKYLRILSDVAPKAEDYGEYTCGTFIMPSEQNEMSNQSSSALDTLMVQPPSTNENVNISESSEWFNSEFKAENLSLSNDGWNLQNLFLTKSIASKETSEENLFKRVVDSFETCDSASRKSSACSPESPFRHESCIASNVKGESNQEMEPDSLCIKPLLDHSNRESFEVSSDPVNDLQPNSNDLQSEAVLPPTNNHLDSSNTQGRKLILPQNAVPFSDEWLAAIEAAGEDILTKKGGAVQNSPTEKCLPDPSPWSPVKKKNNQIGPFDCTKHTNILPPDSN